MKRILFFLSAVALSISTAATVKQEASPLKPMAVHAVTTRNIVDALAVRHYVPAVLDDELSSQIFDAYLDNLDPGKSYLLQQDIREFQVYRYFMDDALRRGDLGPAFEIFNRYHARVVARFEKVLATLEGGIDQFDFTRTEELRLDRKEAPFASTSEELDDLWRRRLKDSVLDLRLAGKDPEAIQALLKKRFGNRLSRIRQTNSEDVYQLYLNSFTRTYDPHTQYLTPRTSENFKITLSLSLEGIGAVLQREDEYTKVVSLVPAGPADKAGQLQPNDRIIGVGQGKSGELIDVVGWRLDEVVQLIRGKKDTLVRLDIIPALSDTSGSKVIQIIRNEVQLEEQSARAEVLEIEQFGYPHRMGVITIPTFYMDFRAHRKGERNFRSTSRDVKKLIHELVEQDVEGIVIDLRNNSGGELNEARILTGLFIDRGPTVQIRKKNNRVEILDDPDNRVVYGGPLAVLVNRLSASASEIFAGAIQDYGRGIVIGNQTFGKGTVQSLLPLNRGQLKLTLAKFYRISGESTQHKGVIPDIAYPSSYDPDSIGESTLDQPLVWDRIRPAPYRVRKSIGHLMPELRSLHRERVSNNPEFNYLEEAFAYRRARSEEDTITLNELERVSEKNERDAFWVSLENRKREALGQTPISSLDAPDKEPERDTTLAPAGNSTDAVSLPRHDAQGSDQSVDGADIATAAPPDEPEPPDPFVLETGHILLDLISLEARTAREGSGS